MGEDIEKLVEGNLAWLRGWLRGRIRDPETVDDLCQESFLRALRSLEKLRSPERFPAWLFRIAQNLVRDHLRSEVRRRRRFVSDEVLEGFEAERSGPAPEDAEEAEKLLEAIQALPARFRDPLLLRHSRDLSYREIGEILGISENAVQVRIFRARRFLRKKYPELAGGSPGGQKGKGSAGIP